VYTVVTQALHMHAGHSIQRRAGRASPQRLSETPTAVVSAQDCLQSGYTPRYSIVHRCAVRPCLSYTAACSRHGHRCSSLTALQTSAELRLSPLITTR